MGNELSDKVSRLSFQVEGLEGALDIERRHRLAATMACEQSQARIQELALALDNEALQRSAELQRLGQEWRRSAAEVMRSCLGSIDQLSCSLEKETQDREALEESVQKAMMELQVDFKSLDKDVTSFKESCADWQQLEGQMQELQD